MSVQLEQVLSSSTGERKAARRLQIPTVRFEIPLEKPTTDEFNEFNYNKLVLKAFKSLKRKSSSVKNENDMVAIEKKDFEMLDMNYMLKICKLTVSQLLSVYRKKLVLSKQMDLCENEAFESSSNIRSQNDYGEEESDSGEENGVSSVTKSKKKNSKYEMDMCRYKLKNFANLGAGYDESDSFIDNSDAHDANIPKNMVPTRGGFYINGETIELRTKSSLRRGDTKKQIDSKKDNPNQPDDKKTNQSEESESEDESFSTLSTSESSDETEDLEDSSSSDSSIIELNKETFMETSRTEKPKKKPVIEDDDENDHESVPKKAEVVHMEKPNSAPRISTNGEQIKTTANNTTTSNPQPSDNVRKRKIEDVTTTHPNLVRANVNNPNEVVFPKKPKTVSTGMNQLVNQPANVQKPHHHVHPANPMKHNPVNLVGPSQTGSMNHSGKVSTSPSAQHHHAAGLKSTGHQHPVTSQKTQIQNLTTKTNVQHHHNSNVNPVPRVSASPVGQVQKVPGGQHPAASPKLGPQNTSQVQSQGRSPNLQANVQYASTKTGGQISSASPKQQYSNPNPNPSVNQQVNRMSVGHSSQVMNPQVKSSGQHPNSGGMVKNQAPTKPVGHTPANSQAQKSQANQFQNTSLNAAANFPQLLNSYLQYFNPGGQ